MIRVSTNDMLLFPGKPQERMSLRSREAAATLRALETSPSAGCGARVIAWAFSVFGGYQLWRMARPDLPAITSGYHHTTWNMQDGCEHAPWNLVGKPSNTVCNLMTIQLTSSFWGAKIHIEMPIVSFRYLLMIVSVDRLSPRPYLQLCILLQTGNLRPPNLVLSPTWMVLANSIVRCWKFVAKSFAEPLTLGSKECKLHPCA